MAVYNKAKVSFNDVQVRKWIALLINASGDAREEESVWEEGVWAC